MKDKNFNPPSIKKNAVFNTFRNLLVLLFPLVTFPYSSRVLLPEGIGQVSFARSFIDYFILIATLGVSTYGIRETAKLRDDRKRLSKFSKEILTINAISTVVAYLLLFVALICVPRLTDYRSLLLVISAKILFVSLGMEWLFSGMEDYKYLTIRAFIFQLISVILLFAFVHRPEDCLKYASIAVISNVGSNICNWFYSKKYIDFFSSCKLELRRHIKPIFTLFAMAEVSIVYSALDVTMLGFICGNREVGIYTSATRINGVIIQFVVAIGTVVLPRLSYYITQNDKEKFNQLVHKSFDFFFLISIPSAIGLCLVGHAAILAFSGKNFLAAIPIMRIMSPIIIIAGINSVIGAQTFVPMGKEKMVLYALLVGATSNIILNFMLIPKYHVAGAAIATLISQSILSGLELFWGRNFIDLNQVGRFFILYLGNALVMVPFVLLCVYKIPELWLSTFFAIITGIIIYSLLLIAEKNHFSLDFINAIKRRLSPKRI